VGAIVAASVELDRAAYTLEHVVIEEWAVFEAAKALAERTRAVALRALQRGLDAQQRAAFAHLGADRNLAIVTGIAGAGKSRLQRDVAAAYADAGYRVIGVTVAGDAARALGEEVAIDARTVAKVLADLEGVAIGSTSGRSCSSMRPGRWARLRRRRSSSGRPTPALVSGCLATSRSTRASAGARCCGGSPRSTRRSTCATRGGHARRGCARSRRICAPAVVSRALDVLREKGVAYEVVDAILELAHRVEPEYPDNRAWEVARSLAQAALELGSGHAASARVLLLHAIGDHRLSRARNPIRLLIRGLVGDDASKDRFLFARKNPDDLGRVTSSPPATNACEALAPGLRETLIDTVRRGTVIDDRWLRGRDIPLAALEIVRKHAAEEAARKSATPLCDELAARDPTEYSRRLEEALASVEIPSNLGLP
jgi:hypothetical protein